MSLDDLTSKLEFSEDEKFKVLLDMLIQNEALSRTIISLMAQGLAERHHQDAKVFQEAIEHDRKEQFDLILSRLYERYGRLPPEIHPEQ